MKRTQGAREWERSELLAMGGFEASLAKPLAGGAHFRPYPGAVGSLLMLWEAVHASVHVADPPPAEPELNDLFPELVLRALTLRAQFHSSRHSTTCSVQ